jgi:hypothetical protein
MYIAIGILVIIFISISISRSFYNRNWALIYTAYGNEKYFSIIAKLKAEGVKFRINIPNRGFDNRVDRFKDNTQYDIYVKKDEEHIAVKALYKRD